jgi:hypothetical protein
VAQRSRRGGPRDGDGDNGERDREHESGPWDDPVEHHRIEKYRFVGSLPATPELYALAREQWNRLPGAVVRPSMTGVDDQAPSAPQQPDQAPPGDEGPEQ